MNHVYFDQVDQKKLFELSESSSYTTSSYAEFTIESVSVRDGLRFFSTRRITEDCGNAEKSTAEECCICMDRKAQIMLSCNHNYCEQCIDAW